MEDRERVLLASKAETLRNNAAFAAAVGLHRQALLERFADSDQPCDAPRWAEIHAEIRALDGLVAARDSLMTDDEAIERHKQFGITAR